MYEVTKDFPKQYKYALGQDLQRFNKPINE